MSKTNKDVIKCFFFFLILVKCKKKNISLSKMDKIIIIIGVIIFTPDFRTF